MFPRATDRRVPSLGVVSALALRHPHPLHEDVDTLQEDSQPKPNQQNQEHPNQPQVSKIWVSQTKFWATSHLQSPSQEET